MVPSPPRHKCNLLITIVTFHVTLNIIAVSVLTGYESRTLQLQSLKRRACDVEPLTLHPPLSVHVHPTDPPRS